VQYLSDCCTSQSPCIPLNEYHARLWEIIQAKASNKEIKQAPAEQQVSVINMMDALQQMLEQAKKKDAPRQRSRRKVSKESSENNLLKLG